MRRKRWITTPRADVAIDWDMTKGGGSILHFAINCRVEVLGTWYDVCRYDTCHGRFHMHRFWKPLPQQVDDLAHRMVRPDDWDRAWTLAAADIKEHWSQYASLLLAAEGLI